MTNDDDDRGERKERVLHTRVPAVLEQELKRLADAWRVPVSNVVRAILEDAVEAVDLLGRKAEGELHGFAERLQTQRDLLRGRVVDVRPAEPPEPEITPPVMADASPCPADPGTALDGLLGFRRLVLASDAACTLCGARLPRGSAAMLGERDDGGPRVLLADTCRHLPRTEA